MSAPDVTKPADDPFNLVGSHWPVESEGSYHAAELVSDAAATTSQGQAHSATDARSKMVGEEGKTAESVSDGYDHLSARIHEQAIHFTTISGWMVDAAAVVRTAKTNISDLVSAGTSEIREALDSELKGTPVTPSSSELGDKYRGEIASISSKLTTDLDGIGHSLAGAPGASTTPAYVRTAPTATAPTIQQAAHQEASGQAPEVTPQRLPEMPRASAPSTTESPSGASAPATPVTPHSVNPTLANLIGGGGQSTGTPNSPSAKSPSGPTSGTPAGQGAQAHQPTETHQNAKSTGLPHIPSAPLPDLPAVAADIATTVTSAASGHQLPTSTTPSTPGSSLPASTGSTPGTSGTPPITPLAPGLAPIGGGLPTPPVMQAPPVAQASPATPTPAAPAPSPAQSPPPAAPRGPVADLAWLQRTYGLAPGLDLPKSENHIAPMLFIADLPENEAHLHCVLATIRHQFERSGWVQPLAVALIKRGFETRLVYVTSDAISIHPSGVRLPEGVLPLDEMPGTPATSELSGSLMVSEKLTALIPRGWEVESLLSTVPGGEDSQSSEQFQELVEGGELLNCSVSRARDDVDVDEAMSTFARVALGSGGCGELDTESARLRSARWVGLQPVGYLDVLSRWYLSDAAESMSRGNWGEAVWASERYMSIRDTEKQVA